MTRDLFCYYPCPVQNVYGAFLRTANEQFGKNCREEMPGVVISFGLNYSFKYNMNGGAVTLHFMPYQNGTMVAMRYSVVQLFGARYEKHATDMTSYADKLLGAGAQWNKQMKMTDFTAYEANLRGGAPVSSAPAAAGGPVCPNCGSALTPGAKFCVGCGKPVPAAPAVCPNCGRAFGDGERFCVGCGAKRPE